uniref:Protein arginine N-methyltransferase 2 n=1 Tax=Mus musculus TaxID=10090 RepID=A0A1W2P6Z3_MOUSE
MEAPGEGPCSESQVIPVLEEDPVDYGCEMQLLQDGAQLQLQLQPEEFVAIADYTATDETQLFERRKNSYPETNHGGLVVGRARRLLWLHPCEPPRQATGGIRPGGHLAGRGVLRQLWNSETSPGNVG